MPTHFGWNMTDENSDDDYQGDVCSRCSHATILCDDERRSFNNINGVETTDYVCFLCTEQIDGFLCWICDEHVEYENAQWCTICIHLVGDFPPRYCLKCWDTVGIYDDEHISAHRDCLDA